MKRRKISSEGYSDMEYLIKTITIITVFIFFSQLPLYSRPVKVAFLNTDTNPAMSDFSRAFHAAAEDLGMEAIEVIVDEWPASMEKNLQALLESPKRPDYLIIIIHKGTSVSLLRTAEKAKVPVFVVISGLVPADQKKYGGPRETFKYWIGQVLPDDDNAGYDLANILIDSAKKKGKVDKSGRVQLIAFGGNPADQCAVERNNGLHRAVASRKDVNFLQLTRANWAIEMARDKAPRVFMRYKKIDAFWCANDAMAIGVLPEIRKIPYASRPLLASVDWLPEIISSIRKGEVIASLGGQTLDPAWAMVLIHDYHAGKDFASDRVDFRSKLYPITRKNVDFFMQCFPDRDWGRIDFRKFSRVYNKSLVKYDFSFGAVLRQMFKGKKGK